MVDPNQVDHSRFPVDEIVYDDGEFSIAWGTWDGTQRCLGMRWNGQGDDPGYPKLFSNPVWLVLPKDLTLPVVTSLLDKKSADAKAILRVLSEIITP